MLPDYVAPRSIEEALHLLQVCGQDAAPIAGGTDLLPRMRAGLRTPLVIVDLRRLSLNAIYQHGVEIRIGATVTHAKASRDPLVALCLPALAQACSEVGGPPVRNRGTLGGNLVNASPAADTAPPLLAYGAQVILAGPAGVRSLDLEAFFLGPGQTAMQPGELLTEIRVPLPSAGTRAIFLKLGRRQAMAIAIVSAAVCVSYDESGLVSAARVAIGSAAPIPLRVRTAERLLAGSTLAEEVVAAAAAEATRTVSPISDVRAGAEYRRKMSGVLVARALRLVRDEQ